MGSSASKFEFSHGKLIIVEHYMNKFFSYSSRLKSAQIFHLIIF